MPINKNIKKVLVLGSGPIIIGQAAEFDYSGTQACRALKEEGIETVLINSNPATIMTDKEIADKVYIEPLTLEYVEKVIKKEEPDSILPGMGGQTALNLAVDLYDSGVLEKYGVDIIGTPIEAIKVGEDRELFRELMKEIGQPVVQSEIVTTMDEGIAASAKIGYPVIVRPAYTLGGSGGGIADNEAELKVILSKGLNLSLNSQVLIEKSIKGWKEIEYEVMRDGKGTCITVCNMENIDPVGIHTGDSIVAAPSQTLSDVEYQMLRTASLDIIDAIGIEGGCNVQLALHPESYEYVVIEINPRVSRSSALASKATGYPIAKVATKIALGYYLDEIENSVTKKTFACFEPVLDYIVLKIPKWPFDKLQSDIRSLGTQMAATGEVMAIGNNFEAALLKAVRSLENSQYTLFKEKYSQMSIVELREMMKKPCDELLYITAELLRRGYSIEKVNEITGIDNFFIHKILNIVENEELLRRVNIEDLTSDWIKKLKYYGFSDKGISQLVGCKANDIMNLRLENDIVPAYKIVDTCSGEFDAVSPYYYSTYEQFDEVEVSDKKKIVVIGSGPIRIGQGVEFDYCCVHCVFSLKNMGVETIIINNNPETVSTDFDISDKLYFEPLTEEDVYNIILKEKPDGVILQFGGQTAIKLAEFIDSKGIKIFGTTSQHIDTAEDREKFEAFLESLDILRPQGVGVWSVEDGKKAAGEIGYPVLVRPSFVLGGQGMEITYNDTELENYLSNAFEKDSKNPVLIDKYLNGKEIEVDAISDGNEILIPGIMEHLEKAGVHSGDSISIYPPVSLSQEILDKVVEISSKIAKNMGVKGIINIQFIECDNEVYIIEVNPRSSRTVPFISKVTGVPMVDLAVKCMMGEELSNLGYGTGLYKSIDNYVVKVPVFSSQKISGVEVSLGPEMKSTGEVLGLASDYEEALYKGFLAAGVEMPDKDKYILATVKPKDKETIKSLAQRFDSLGYKIAATEGTSKDISSVGVDSKVVNKIGQEDDILDFIQSGQVGLIVNTPTKANDSKRDGFMIRRKSVENGVDLLTNLETVDALCSIIENKVAEKDLDVFEISEIYAEKESKGI
ncbi:carbamoyl-phosphate synthase large subunit [Dethiosulfatibacter aminovorans DSM 17477]|uniref:Carbamoyl phosphate synthase large chain n=1 Tax=Dethiosulfatibacter aminovorans DSM 17477 TaxID=1121476 RepID=A0A1M6CZM9_9FIRM|nr:carbamoyl-phosphate synthase (glutamine-hydrolyzing) large subunit [Dethiosulfatibacter aminovorans]SHI66410.1 carbamoyl-phosphate synthase large subunit [Dethiosulfatibacter aminovorans DSM 17477]